MRNAPLSLVRAAGPALVDGINVAQLLHGIGEASASSSAIDLFGLCLGAQRVLEQVQAGSAGILPPDEAAMLAAYRATAGNQRDILLAFARAMAGQAEPPRTVLATVHSLWSGVVQ